jgi:hypothetical protein
MVGTSPDAIRDGIRLNHTVLIDLFPGRGGHPRSDDCVFSSGLSGGGVLVRTQSTHECVVRELRSRPADATAACRRQPSRNPGARSVDATAVRARVCRRAGRAVALCSRRVARQHRAAMGDDGMASIQSEVRVLLASWSAAIRTKNIDRLMSHSSPDVVYFDVVPPPRYAGSVGLRDDFAPVNDGVWPGFQGVSGTGLTHSGPLLAWITRRVRQ